MTQEAILSTVRVLLADCQRRADCRRRQVGAVLVARNGVVVGFGWNRLPDESCEAGACPRGLLSYDEVPASAPYTNCLAVHAEGAALATAAGRARGGTCYVTAEPCPGCAAALEEAGITDVQVLVLAD